MPMSWKEQDINIKVRNLCICVMLGASLTAQKESNKVVQAYRLADNSSLILDGRIDEPEWFNVAFIDDFKMQVPVEGGNPSEKTEIRVAYDQHNLYLAVQCWDSNVGGIKYFQKKRDSELDTDDRFMWILDTFNDGRNAYFFAINPGGVFTDGLLSTGQGTSVNFDWDGIWSVWTQVHANGWSAEIRIPFRTLNFSQDKTGWGINFQRTIRRKNEELVWSGFLRSQGLRRPQNAGTLTGLTDVSQGIGLETIPYLAGRRLSARSEDNLVTDYQGDFGFDVNYSITPGLKVSFTYNTDFAETEVDTRQINLTRFPLFFPEKRDFFLEGSSIYSFAPASGVIPYFSRQIGLKDGRSIPIGFGSRIIGRMGNYDIAIQHVRTNELESIAPEDFGVFRLRRNFGRENRIGFIYTFRSTDDGEDQPFTPNDRHTLGADLELNTSRFLGNQILQFQAFFVYHNASSPAHNSTMWDRTTRGVRINFPNQPWSGHASYREFGTAFDPAVGFHPRVGFRRFQPSLGFNPLFEKSPIIRDIDVGLRFEHLMDMDWTLLTQEIRFELFEVTFESSESIEFSISREYERLTEDFDILRDNTIVIPTDEYVNWGISLELQSAPFRPVSGRIDLDLGGFWSGSRKQIGVSVTGRPVNGINLTATFVRNDVELDEGSFSTDILRLNASFDLTPFVSFSSFIQYDNLSKSIGMNNRFRWILQPGNEIFLVYNQDWENYLDRFRTLNNAVTMKAVYTHRF